MVKTTHKNDDVSLDLVVDPRFTGIIRGDVHDLSEGCSLTGQLVLQIHRPTKIKHLGTSLTGQCRVHFKTTNAVGVPTYDGNENHIILKKRVIHIGKQTVINNTEDIFTPITYEPGVYKFHFHFDIPSTLPHTFRSKYGSIDYELSATITRDIFFNPSIRISRPITLRRCLMNDLDPIAPATQTIIGTDHPDIVTYSAISPSMVYGEGGLLTLQLYVQLKQPKKYSVRMVTCGLQERVLYRTTGVCSLTNQPTHHEESSFPLGYSTFFPSQHHEYNPEDLHNYSAIFRLYPRVHPDNKSTLIVVQHHLNISMLIENNEILAKRRRRKSNDSPLSKNTGDKSILSHLSAITGQREHNISISMPSALPPASIQPSDYHNHFIRSLTTSPLERSPSQASTGSITEDSLPSSPMVSFVSVAKGLQPFQPDIVQVSSQNTPTERTDTNTTIPGSTRNNNNVNHSLQLHHHFNPLKFLRDHKNEQSFECSLSMPIIVTSREEYREGEVPALPDYESSIGQPPSYRISLETLPPVPIYPRQTSTDDDTRSSAFST
jgi:hypothetical protein